MANRPHPKYARTNPSNPAGWATCMRSGFCVNQKDLITQTEWRGLRVMPTGTLAYAKYIDKPQRQLGANILSADPVALMDARPEQYAADENCPRCNRRGQFSSAGYCSGRASISATGSAERIFAPNCLWGLSMYLAYANVPVGITLRPRHSVCVIRSF